MLKIGDFAVKEGNGHFHLIQVLAVSTDLLVKDFWESSSAEIADQEIRSWVKRASVESIEDYVFLKNEPLTEKDESEIERFLEIEHGLKQRRDRTASMAALVNEAILNEEFNKALELLTEWAMLEKYKPEIYLLREACLRKLGRDQEADYERHVYNTLTGK